MEPTPTPGVTSAFSPLAPPPEGIEVPFLEADPEPLSPTIITSRMRRRSRPLPLENPDDQGQVIAGSTSKRRNFVIRGSAQARAACAGGQNLQAFTGALGAKAPAVSAAANGKFTITGSSDLFNDANAAISRSW